MVPVMNLLRNLIGGMWRLLLLRLSLRICCSSRLVISILRMALLLYLRVVRILMIMLIMIAMLSVFLLCSQRIIMSMLSRLLNRCVVLVLVYSRVNICWIGLPLMMRMVFSGRILLVRLRIFVIPMILIGMR